VSFEQVVSAISCAATGAMTIPARIIITRKKSGGFKIFFMYHTLLLSSRTIGIIIKDSLLRLQELDRSSEFLKFLKILLLSAISLCRKHFTD
jgi:hypothetical protein